MAEIVTQVQKKKKNVATTQVDRTMKFLERVADNGYYKCLVCGSDPKPVYLKGTKLSNLVVHFKNCHSDIYNSDIVCNVGLKEMAIERLKLLQQCVEMTTVNKEHFSILTKSAFQKIIAPQLEKFAKAGMPLNLTAKNLEPVKEHISLVAENIREALRAELSDRFIALMLDVGSKNRRSILGISVQFIDDDGNVQIRSIGMVKLNQSHTSTYLAETLIECLNEYKIKLHHIVAITTDNASNMGAMVRNVNENLEECLADEAITTEALRLEKALNDASDSQIENILRGDELSDEEEYQRLFEEGYEFEVLLEHVASEFTEKYGSSVVYINGISCAAHTLQLAVLDAIDSLENRYKNIIGLCRVAAKILRRQNVMYDLQNHDINIKLPRLDSKTRWSSKYYLV